MGLIILGGGGQYEVKSPYDQGYARSPREYYKPSYSDRVQETYASPPRTGYVRTPEYNRSGYVRTPGLQVFLMIKVLVLEDSSKSVYPMMGKVVSKIS